MGKGSLRSEYQALGAEGINDLASEANGDRDKRQLMLYPLVFGHWALDSSTIQIKKPHNGGFFIGWCERGESNPHRVTSTGS